MLLFGCRHSEAAYVIYANAFRPNKFAEFQGCRWAVTVPPGFNKTKQLYKWPVPAKMEWVVKVVKELHERVPGLKEQLGDPATKFKRAIGNWFSRRVMPDAAAKFKEVTPRTPATDGHGYVYGLRTIRAYHGAVWAREFHRARRLRQPIPFNPLQHTNPKTTLQHYVPAEEDSPASTPVSERRNNKRMIKQATVITRMLPGAF